MSKERVDQIREMLKGFGTDPEKGYTNQEIIDRLVALENALLAGVYEKNHTENMLPQDLLKHFSALAEEFALNDSEAYKRFAANMKALNYTVKSYITGQKGEQLGKSALKPLEYEKNVKILYNIALENADMKTEYDAIVIAPYGMFVIEMKNWSGNVTLTKDGFLIHGNGSVSMNLAARMLVKETLLRDILGELFPVNYHNVLLFPENKTRFCDEYGQIPVGYGAGISNNIRFCSIRGGMSEEEIAVIAEKISAAHIEQLTYCTVKCQEIIDDYALLMSQMEKASGKAKKERVEIYLGTTLKVSPAFAAALEKGQSRLHDISWRHIGGVAAGITAALLGGFFAGRVFNDGSR